MALADLRVHEPRTEHFERFGEGPALMVQIRGDKLSLSSTLMFQPVHLMVRSAMLRLPDIHLAGSPFDLMLSFGTLNTRNSLNRLSDSMFDCQAH